MSDLLRTLSELSAADIVTVGGKAAMLGEAKRRGERVPEGFVITPTAFQAVVRENALDELLTRALEAARRDDMGPAGAFSERMAAAAWPTALAHDVVAAAVGLKSPLAVRSSATLEDGDASAAAGVFETVLDVAAEDVLQAANRCWAAAFQPSVFAHLLAMGLDPGSLSVALLVQRLLEPQVSGVLFTTDPADETRQHMRIAIVEGRADQLVQGETGREYQLARKGGWEAVEGPDQRCLGALQGAGLLALGQRLERKAGRALDIEWAVEDGRLYLLQSRPVATLPPGTENRPPIRWSRDLAEERFPDPISPLGWSALQSALRVNLATLNRRFGLRAARPEEVATVIGGYVYNNRDFFAIPGSMSVRPSVHWPFLGAYARVVGGLLTPAGLKRLKLLRQPKRSQIGNSPLDPRFQALAGFFRAYVFEHARDVETRWEKEFPDHMAAMAALDAEDPKDMNAAAMVDYIDRLGKASDDYMEPDLAIYVIKVACRWAIEEIGAMVDGRKDPELIARLTGGLAANATLAMNAALEALHAAVAADAYLAAAFRLEDGPGVAAAWERSQARPLRDAFLREYGHVTLSWDIRQPTYRDRPALLDEMLALRLRARQAASVETHREALAEAREREALRIETVLADAPWAPGFFRELLATLHTFMRLDEAHHLDCARLIPTERRLIAEIARRAAPTGVIEREDDLYFLTLTELVALISEEQPWSRRRLVARRRAAFERAVAQRPVEEFLGDRPVPPAHAPATTDGALQGRGASPGQAEGIVRVVTTLADMAAFQPGEILVTTTPKPSYTPLFAVAGALVTARGSTLSHGLISAREYGLPAVTELTDALDRLHTGQRVRVDGALGTVTVMAPVAAELA